MYNIYIYIFKIKYFEELVYMQLKGNIKAVGHSAQGNLSENPPIEGFGSIT